jgi:hypothetical protein
MLDYSNRRSSSSLVRTLAFHAYQMRGQPVTRDFVLIIGKAGIQIPVTALCIRIHTLELEYSGGDLANNRNKKQLLVLR